MEGNIVGEPLDDFVAKQVGIRQSAQFGGKNSLRTDNQLQYLTNKNAWVKLASSVTIEEGLVPLNTSNNTGQSAPSPGGFTPGGFTPGGGIVLPGSSGAGSTTTPTNTTPGPIPGLTNLRQAKSQRLRKLGIPNPQNYGGSKLAEAAILFNTLSSYTNSSSPLSSRRAGISNTNTIWNNSSAYGIGGTEFGIQPPPGIVSVQVDSLNRGSIRKANITLKAHNRFQFDLIELLYLRLGFTMMLEWGWDKYLDNNGTLQQVGNTIIEEKWFTSTGITQLEMLKHIQEMRKKYSGNVDGFFGKVSNFNWSFNPDGTYDIAIDLITIGDVIESIKVNTAVKPSTTISSVSQFESVEGLEELFGNIAEASTLNSLGFYLFERVLYMVNNSTTGLTDNSSSPPSLAYVQIEPKIVQVKNEITWTLIPNFPPGRRFYYVRLGHLLQVLQNYIVPQIQNGNNASTAPQLYVSYDELSNKISYFPNQISLDPRVCIFNYSDTLNSYGDITGVNSPFLGSGTLPLAPYLQVDQSGTYGGLMNLYMNLEFISQLLISNGGPDQELSLFKFLQDLCNGINDALGGVNKLEPVIKDDSTVVIIDQTLSKPVKDIVELEVYGYNTKNQISNFVKDVKFVSKITPQLASMISIGATAAGSSTSEIDGTAFLKWNEELIDRFTQKISIPTLPLISPITAATVPPQTTGVFKPEDLKNLTDKNYGFYLVNAFGGTSNTVSVTGANSVTYPAFVDPTKARYFEFDDTFITQGKAAYKSYINELNDYRFVSSSVPSTEVGFIPLSFDLVLDGMSGIKIYNKLSINSEFLPSNYPESLKFVITKVNHNISNNNWETSLSTISMPETEPYKHSPSPSGNAGSGANSGASGGNAGGGNSGGGNSANSPKVTITSGIDLTQSNGDLMYYPQETKKLQLYLHHTAGNPAGDKSTVERTIRNDWAPKGFPLSTHYMIQGSGFTEYIFEEKYWSNHLAAQNSTKNLDKISLSVEIGAYGFVELNGNGQYINWAGGVVPTNQVTAAVNKYLKPSPYRGYYYFQKYTDAQITALENLIVKWKKDHPGIIWEFDFDEMFPPSKDETKKTERTLSQKALDGIPGVYSHCSVRTDKVDIFPQANLITMLKRHLKDVTKY